ncbi:MAG: hypothetical protein WDZ58_07235 [Gemmatimonadaceae bacterium]
MRYSLSVIGFALVLGCTTTTAPDRVRQLGEIAGFNNGDPYVTIEQDGRRVDVSITTYGDGCHTQGETEVVMNGLGAEVTPYDYSAARGSFCTRELRSSVHRASLNFERSGMAQIRIRGIDASTRSSTNLIGDTLVVVRTVELF